MLSRPVILGLGEILWDLLPSGKQLGGAPANFAFHAMQLGGDGVVVSCVGDDALGREIINRVRSLGLRSDFIAVDPKHPTGTVDVKLDGAGVPSYVINERVAWDFVPMTPPLEDLARRADAVCFGSLAQRSPVSRETIRCVLAATKPGCLRVFDLNLRQHYHDRDVIHASLGVASILKLNDEETPIMLDALGLPSGASLEEGLRRLFDRYALRLIALTRGGRGSLLIAPDRMSEHPGIKPSAIADTVGAGDSFTATVVMGMLNGKDLDAINDHANRVASYVCSQSGATPTLPDELASL